MYILKQIKYYLITNFNSLAGRVVFSHAVWVGKHGRIADLSSRAVYTDGQRVSMQMLSPTTRIRSPQVKKTPVQLGL